VTSDVEKRRAIEEHWAASEAGDDEVEQRLYAEDAILDYPQSGERFVGRTTIAEQRRGNPAERHFRLRRVLGQGSVWVSECVITYDGAPTNSVSIMEFDDGLVVRETQYFADPFEPPAARARLAQQLDPE
jgi:SnoaL-like protein